MYSFLLQIPLPDSVTGRYLHSLSSFVLDPNHVFMIIVGGSVKMEQKDIGGGVMKWFHTTVTDPNITILIELGKIILTDYVFICTIHFVHTHEQYYCFCTNTLYTINTRITQTYNTLYT